MEVSLALDERTNQMRRITYFSITALLLAPLAALHVAAPKPTTPNIICMMAD